MENPARTDFPTTPGSPSTGDGALARVASTVHGAVDKVAIAADDAVRNAKPAIDRVAAIAHRTVDKATSAAAPTVEWMSAKGDDLSARGTLLIDDTSKLVAANPMKSIGLALIVGLLIGRIMRAMR